MIAIVLRVYGGFSNIFFELALLCCYLLLVSVPVGPAFRAISNRSEPINNEVSQNNYFRSLVN